VGEQPSGPASEKRGYHSSFSHYIDPGIPQYWTTNNFRTNNLKIVAYVEAENRLSVQEVLALRNEGIVIAAPDLLLGLTRKNLYVVGGIWARPGRLSTWGLSGLKELDRLMKSFNVSRLWMPYRKPGTPAPLPRDTGARCF
jgi:hypothetical protein